MHHDLKAVRATLHAAQIAAVDLLGGGKWKNCADDARICAEALQRGLAAERRAA